MSEVKPSEIVVFVDMPGGPTAALLRLVARVTQRPVDHVAIRFNEGRSVGLYRLFDRDHIQQLRELGDLLGGVWAHGGSTRIFELSDGEDEDAPVDALSDEITSRMIAMLTRRTEDELKRRRKIVAQQEGLGAARAAPPSEPMASGNETPRRLDDEEWWN